MLAAILYSTLAGATIPLGGWLAAQENIAPDWVAQEVRHAIIAFGGGALIAAVALVLVPEGSAKLSILPALAAFAGGGVFFAWLDRAIARHGGSHGQLVAMLSDFVPEAIALGALLATGSDAALLIAGLIALQNLPEGFNAWREMGNCDGGARRRRLGIFCGMALIGPVAALFGHVVLVEYPAMLGAIMLFAGGGVLYLVFNDIAPQARLENDWYPPLGAVAGFALGLGGDMLIG